jgi:hypothetical protein
MVKILETIAHLGDVILGQHTTPSSSLQKVGMLYKV